MTGLEMAGAIAIAKAPITAKLFESVSTRIEKTLKGPGKSLAVKAIASLKGYGDFLEETNERVSTFKTFANPTTPVALLDHFVTTKLKTRSGQSVYDQDELIDKLAKKARVVISATAGYGKSMLMRFIALSLYENPRGKIPLFVELRHLNRMKSPDLISYIHGNYKRNSSIEMENFQIGLKSGMFVFILDGFDELNHEIRPLIEAQILEISRTFALNSIVVSGRPDDRFLSWRTFTVSKIQPMDKLQVVELINKLEYDRGTKKRFISKINTGLYDTHESFLSTPLLAILMLLTYEENANIPDKMHLFYSKAFETLFHKHDAMKEQYDRQRKSSLQIDDFEKVFSIFCLKTYVLEK